MAQEFRAPWSRSLKWASQLSVVMLLGIAIAGFFILPARLPLERILVIVLPACILAGGLLFMVSGYTLTASALVIERPLWSTTYLLSDLVSVAGDAEALKGALRLFGNGGLFSFTGLFWKRRLGLFHAYGTDPGRAVIVKFRRRTIVVTPDDPQRFIVRVRTHQANVARA